MDIAVVVDASVWVSWLRPQDINHHASLLWMEKYIDEGGFLVAPSLLSIEVAAALSRRTGQADLSRDAVRRLRNLDAMLFVPLDATLEDLSVDMATDLQLRAGDAIYVAVAHQLNIPLVSWDNEQLQRASSLIPTYTPDTYPFEAVQP